MRVCVIGAGAAGMTASVFLAREGADVILVEKNEKFGKKLYITGKGRCNLTNDCELADLFQNVVRGEKFCARRCTDSRLKTRCRFSRIWA